MTNRNIDLCLLVFARNDRPWKCVCQKFENWHSLREIWLGKLNSRSGGKLVTIDLNHITTPYSKVRIENCCSSHTKSTLHHHRSDRLRTIDIRLSRLNVWFLVKLLIFKQHIQKSFWPTYPYPIFKRFMQKIGAFRVVSLDIVQEYYATQLQTKKNDWKSFGVRRYKNYFWAWN